ncbi:GNAT family N-acetyltransferase [Microbacterium sp. 3J1]|uniref:GNAT family N-acetyltransferase n=1 Tax=Microbacterium sp. 3J1 TaxID=861269 RepID=UPI000A84E48D|nr:GNAT family N-acetyltransferase [Microbacterium sp. 3J1]
MPVQLMPLAEDRFDAWREGTRSRLIALRQESGMQVGEDAVAQTDAVLDLLLADGAATATSSILSIGDGAREIGSIWLASNDGILFVIDLAFTSPPESRHHDDLLAALVAMARDHGAHRISLSLYAPDSAGRAFVEGRGFTCASIQMLLESLPRRETQPRLELEPMTAERFSDFATASEAAFADDLVASGRYSAEDARAESRRQMKLELPDGVASAGQELFTASVGGVEVGVLWLGVRTRDARPHVFILDIEVGADQRRRGHGREIMLAAEREAVRLGADSIGLHVFGFNAAAIRLYESLGYRRTEERFLLSV